MKLIFNDPQWKKTTIVGIGLWLAMASDCFAQQSTPSSSTVNVVTNERDGAVLTRLQTAYRKQSRELQFVLAEDNSTMLKVEPKPVFTWTSLGGWSGDVFVWTGKGRIQMVGCIGSHHVDESTFEFFQEFHSLADASLNEVQLDDAVTWKISDDTGVAHLIPGAPQPAANTTQRMVQMRSLARSFKLGMQVTTDAVEQELRMLSQPLSRVSAAAESGDVIDGALFTFVSSAGTDPEAFLLIEARKSADGLAWTYMVARFTTREIWMSRDGKEVWRAPAIEFTDPGSQIKDAYFYRPTFTATLDEIGAPVE